MKIRVTIFRDNGTLLTEWIATEEVTHLVYNQGSGPLSDDGGSRLVSVSVSTAWQPRKFTDRVGDKVREWLE